jgi:nucleoside-diphosphate-sugar epimerase
MEKKRILLTGASGTVGREIFRELLNRFNDYEISLFLRKSCSNNYEDYHNQVETFKFTHK